MRIGWKLFFLCMGISLMRMSAYNNTVELRGGAFVPLTHVFRGIYGNVGAFVGAQAGGMVREHVEVWGDVDFFNKHGKSIGLCSPTEVFITNFSFGVNFPYACAHDRLIVFFGTGPCIGGTWVRDETLCSDCPCDRSGYLSGGLVIKTGFYALPKEYSETVFVKLFADLVLEWANFCTPCTHQIGGLQIGLSAGIRY